MELVGVKVKLVSDSKLIKETLERMGIANRRKKTIVPSCYLNHYKGEYSISHFKENLAQKSDRGQITDVDICRRDSIISLLYNWGMIQILWVMAIQSPSW